MASNLQRLLLRGRTARFGAPSGVSAALRPRPASVCTAMRNHSSFRRALLACTLATVIAAAASRREGKSHREGNRCVRTPFIMHAACLQSHVSAVAWMQALAGTSPFILHAAGATKRSPERESRQSRTKVMLSASHAELVQHLREEGRLADDRIRSTSPPLTSGSGNWFLIVLEIKSCKEWHNLRMLKLDLLRFSSTGTRIWPSTAATLWSPPRQKPSPTR